MSDFSIDLTRENVLRAISPILKPANADGISGEVLRYSGIPHHNYYLLFMLLVDLLGYKYFGPFEKLAYAIPIEYDGHVYSVVYAKFGMRIVYQKGGDPEAVFNTLQKAMKAAKPYYLWRAEEASTASNLNLLSKCTPLWAKYIYMREQSQVLMEKYEAGKDEVSVEKGYNDDGSFKFAHYSYPAHEYGEQGRWMHEAAVDAFFAWSEQALVHVAVLLGKLTNGKEIADLLKGEFGPKCKLVLDMSSPEDKLAYDDISKLRNELRNYVAHGSFGKDGSTFAFHSAVGTIPLKVLSGQSSPSFEFGTNNQRDWENDYQRIDSFVARLWSEHRSPARLYIEAGFPCILTYTVDGKYSSAMRSDQEMTEFLNFLGRMIDDHANMDF